MHGDDPALAAAVTQGSGKTYVLVHGACHGGWCWKYVTENLRSSGHAVSTPTLTGLGERAHLLSDQVTLGTFVTDVASHIVCEELTEVILVGHSFGGNVVTGVADQIPDRIRHLVYLDAGILQNGQSAFSVIPPQVAQSRRRAAAQRGDALLRPFDVSAFGVPEDHPLAPWMRRRLTPHPLSSYDSELRLTNPVGNGLPVTYVASTRPYYAVLDDVRAWAKTWPRRVPAGTGGRSRPATTR